MGLVIHHDKIDKEIADKLISICPFNAITYNGKLDISSACKMCKMCVKKGPTGAITFEKDEIKICNKNEWVGIAVFIERRRNEIHPVSLELIGKAKELAKKINHPVYALMIGNNCDHLAEQLFYYGVDKVYLFDDKRLENFVISRYTNAFVKFINDIKPSSILVGATTLGRSLAPSVAAKVHTGLTADCTMLEMKENTDLVQIRPAFGGNIMAQIVTPNTRPQFCTVRYKIFSAPAKEERGNGEIVKMQLQEKDYESNTEVLKTTPKATEMDISDAEIIVAVGRGLKSKEDIGMIEEFANSIDAQVACTRPLIEAGWFDPRKQIGLSGRTVKPKLIVTLGISGAIQFVAGMRSSDMIISVCNDPNAPIFDVAHHGFIGDIYEILPKLQAMIKEEKNV